MASVSPLTGQMSWLLLPFWTLPIIMSLNSNKTKNNTGKTKFNSLGYQAAPAGNSEESSEGGTNLHRDGENNNHQWEEVKFPKTGNIAGRS